MPNQRPLQRIDEMTAPPVVGRTYLVPHVLQTNGDFPGMWVPIRGIAHSDPGLGLSIQHFHFDERFLRKTDLKRMGIRDAYTYIVPLRPASAGLRCTDGRIEHKAVKCVTNRSGMAADTRLRFTSGWLNWQDTYEDRSFDGTHCPHTGFDLTTVPADAHGVKVCPLHGLAWCTRTLKNVQRVDPSAGDHDAKPLPVGRCPAGSAAGQPTTEN